MRHFTFDISRRLRDGILEPLHFYTRQRREIDVEEILARGHFAKARNETRCIFLCTYRLVKERNISHFTIFSRGITSRGSLVHEKIVISHNIWQRDVH